jgi:DNA replication protein DnaC
LIGPPGTGKTHLAIALAIKACERGFRVRSQPPRISRLEAAQERNQLEEELRRIERYQLIVVDEVGYLPLEEAFATFARDGYTYGGVSRVVPFDAPR